MEITLPSAELDDALDHPVVRGLLDQISDGAIVIDAHDHRVLAMNPVARDILAYEDARDVGCQCRRLMNSPACTESCPLDKMLQGQIRPEGQRMYYRGRGAVPVLHAHTRMLLLRGPDGSPLAAVELFRDLRQARDSDRPRHTFMGLIGQSEPMRQLYETVEQIAPYDLPVLLTGESGVGKERFADAIHALSARANKPFIKINCAALTPSLVESELFGHVKGAFTGATDTRKGCFEKADGGTVLLDEIGELPLKLQVKLLRVVQDGEMQRVGETKTRRVDVRILGATNRDLAQEVAAGRFRQDLFFRLLGAQLDVPPLRERPGDIPSLAEYFVERFNTKAPDKPSVELGADALEDLLHRRWPGNVRELESAIELAAIRARADDGIIRPHHLRASPSLGADPKELPLDLRELEALAIERAMARTDGNISAAARLLGIDRTTLWRKLKDDE